MKTRICLILAALMVTLSLVGCQRSAAKADGQTAVVEEDSKPQPTKTEPPQNTVKLSWVQPCSVEQAASAAKQSLEDLGLGGSDKPKTRTVTIRDPKTGRTVSKQVPISGLGSIAVKSDRLSAFVRAKSVAGVDYLITIILMPPESCEISIVATGSNPTDILSKHGKFIQNKISEEIQQQQDISNSIPYSKTMIVNNTISEVFKKVNGWRESNHFLRLTTQNNPKDGDSFYQKLSCRTASDIHIEFLMHLIDTNKTKLQIDIQNYEEKEDFPMILRSLEGLLKELEAVNMSEQDVIKMEESMMMSPTESSATSSKPCLSSE